MYTSGHDVSHRSNDYDRSTCSHRVLGTGRSLALEGRYSEALEALHKFRDLNGSEPPLVTAEIGYSEAASGERKAAIATIRQLETEWRTTYVDPYLIALVYLGLKDDDQTYAWLNKAYEARSSFLVSIQSDPKWSAARKDRRFEDVWNRMMQSGSVASAATPVEANKAMADSDVNSEHQ